MNDFHEPVLLTESISALNVKKNGVYVDATFGGGGHSNEILKRLSKDGRLIVFDLDEEAINKNKIIDDRVISMNKNFRYIKNCVNSLGLFKIDCILVDFGFSSFQINIERGFSFKSNTDLDMRMNRSASFQQMKF